MFVKVAATHGIPRLPSFSVGISAWHIVIHIGNGHDSTRKILGVDAFGRELGVFWNAEIVLESANGRLNLES